MGARGPKSQASQLIRPSSDAAGGEVSVYRIVRPDAPYSLTDEQAAIWRTVVDDLPADWFRPHNHALLAQYCRHVATSDALAAMIADCLKGTAPKTPKGRRQIDVGGLDRLLKMQEREGRAASSLATRLRLTIQATRAADTKKPPATIDAPWEEDEDE